MSEVLLDAKGLNCPLPILRAKKALKDIPTGGDVRIIATDPGSSPISQAFCRTTGNELWNPSRMARSSVSSSSARLDWRIPRGAGRRDGLIPKYPGVEMKTTAMARREALTAIGLGLAVAAGASSRKASAMDMELPCRRPSRWPSFTRRSKRRRAVATSRPCQCFWTSPISWDDEALKLVLAYRGGPKQTFDNVDVAGPWLNLMRNSLNAQVFAFRHPDFLVISATHGSAHLGLFDQAMWDKYQLSKLTGGKFERNDLIVDQKGASADPKDFENPEGVYSPAQQFDSGAAAARRGVHGLPQCDLGNQREVDQGRRQSRQALA